MMNRQPSKPAVRLEVLPPLPQCRDCDTHITAHNPGVPLRRIPSNAPSDAPAILFVGQNPGYTEDTHNAAFIGRSGVILCGGWRSDNEHRFDLHPSTPNPPSTFVPGPYVDGARLRDRAHLYVVNAVRCATPSNSVPPERSLAACSRHLIHDIHALAARHDRLAIVCLGAVAVRAIYKHILGWPSKRCTQTEAFTVNGDPQPIIAGRPMPVFTTYHPAYILRNPNALNAVKDHLTLLHTHFLTTAASSIPSLNIVEPGPPCPPQTQRPNHPNHHA